MSAEIPVMAAAADEQTPSEVPTSTATKSSISPANSPEIFADFLERGTVGLHVVDDRGIILWASQSELDLLGYTREEYVGQPIAKFHADQNKIAEILDLLLSGKKVLHYQAPLRCKDGHIEWVEINSSMRVVDGKCSTTRCFSAPVTDKVESKEKSRFLRLLCHELRNPLMGIQGNLELLRSRLSAMRSLVTRPSTTGPPLLKLIAQHVDELTDSAESADLAAKHQAMVLNDTLTLSKLQSEEAAVVPRPVDLAVTVNDVLVIVDVSIRRKNLDLRVEVPDAVRFVKTDVSWAKQVLLNLFTNAIKFTAQGHISLKLSVAEKTAEIIIVRLEVEDSGIGMSESEVSGLFKPFTQANSTISSKYGGTGLGLHIVRGYLAQVGGTIEVETKKGVGTKFVVHLPCGLLSKEEELKTQVAKKPPDLPVASGEPRNILIAEDNIINQKILRRCLDKSGHRIRIANNGLEAVQLFCRFDFDLVFMDIEMPYMDGNIATDAIRKIEVALAVPAPIPIIGLSGNALPDDAKRSTDAGMTAYMTKPFALAVALANVDKHALREQRPFSREERKQKIAMETFQALHPQ